MGETELGVVVSPRMWAERLHRFTVDHGGARVRARVLRAEDALVEDYQVLIVDDVTSFLNLRLVQKVQSSGRRVIGVFDSQDSESGRRRLLELGVDDVIDADASPDEFLKVISALDVAFVERESEVIEQQVPGEPIETSSHRGMLTVVAGGSGGVGATEVALELARQTGDMGSSAVLIDADNVAPTLTQRLGLAVHPNLRTAVDALLHRPDRLSSTLLKSPHVSVVGGLSNPKDWVEVRDGDVVELTKEFNTQGKDVLVNIDTHVEDLSYYGGIGRYSLARAMLAAADRIVLVGLGTPVGTARLLDWIAEARPIMPNIPIHIVINRASKSSYERGEIKQEITRTFSPHSLTYMPEDRRVQEAAWAGECVKTGAFTKAMSGLTQELYTGMQVG